MNETKKMIKDELPKIYSKDLIEVLFMHPYTKIEFLVNELNIHRDTAIKYLKKLEKLGIVKEIKIKNSKFFINNKLFERLKIGLVLK
jgi:Fic family protein